jgi:tRNA-dihydrouridine synthase A
MRRYAAVQVEQGVPLRAITRHMLGMMSGRSGARAWRRTLSEGVNRGSNSPALMAEALRAVGAGDPFMSLSRAPARD